MTAIVGQKPFISRCGVCPSAARHKLVCYIEQCLSGHRLTGVIFYQFQIQIRRRGQIALRYPRHNFLPQRGDFFLSLYLRFGFYFFYLGFFADSV
jgi:hypothetical protein